MKWTRIIKADIYEPQLKINYERKRLNKLIENFKFPVYIIIDKKTKNAYNILGEFTNQSNSDPIICKDKSEANGEILSLVGNMLERDNINEEDCTDSMYFKYEKKLEIKQINSIEELNQYCFDSENNIINKIKKSIENQKVKQKEQEQQSKSKTVYSVELFNNEGDTETSTDCNSYDEAIQAMEKYRNNKTQYVDSWGLSGKGRIIKFTEDEDGNMSNEKVLKTFWL